ncbi:MAG: glycosyl hydrolase family 25, partial [Bacteroidaceae bacterium]|nr:glycosyl hydrolase family 25 [Bacteroidaceae bacterium]
MRFRIAKYIFTVILCLLSFLSLSAQKRTKNKLTAPIPSSNYSGIDVSHHNGKIDWNKVKKNRRIKFVYIKATEGADFVDPEYNRNLKGARKAGFKVGSYHYFHMTSSPEWQFKNFIKHAPKKKQDLVPMVDFETCDGYSIKRTRKALKKFVSLLEKYYGKKPIIYSTMSHYNDILAPEFNRYHLYIGRYSDCPPVIRGKGT